MAVRALIVAIEDYPNVAAGGLAKKLDGTLNAGLAFRDWLQEKWKRERIDAADQHLILCSEPAQLGGIGATSGDIKRALLELQAKGASQTDELYVFLSGHGFTFVSMAGDKTSVLIGSEFESPALSGGACLSVGYLTRWLSAHLGPGRQTYFINLCRNKLDVETVAVGGPFLPFKPTVSGEGSTFVIHAAAEGDVTQVNSKFNEHLFDGLKGQGRAKVWDENGAKVMRVRYSSLKQHLAARLGRPVDGGALGVDTDMDYETFDPPPRTSCTVKIESTSGVKGTVAYMSNRDDEPIEKPLAGLSTVLSLMPDVYRFSVKTASGTIEPALSQAIDLYDNATIVFKFRPEVAVSKDSLGSSDRQGKNRGGGKKSKDHPKALQAGAEFEFEIGDLLKLEFGKLTFWNGGRVSPNTGDTTLKAADNATLRLVIPPCCQLDLTNSSFPRSSRTYDNSQSLEVKPDGYLAVLRQGDVQIGLEEFDLNAGEDREVALGRWQNSQPHAAIAEALGSSGDEVFFSETLGGPVVDTGLDLWLALAGAGRIFMGGSEAGYTTVAKLPLKDFRKLKAGSSPIYVLAGSATELPSLKVAVSDGAEANWRSAKSPSGMASVYEAFFDTKPGPQLLSFRVGKKPPYTVATCASPNRAMLVTIVFDEQGAATVSQFLLPLGKLAHHLREWRQIEWRRQDVKPLVDVQALVRAMRDFRGRRMVDVKLPEAVEQRMPVKPAEQLLYAKWLDPITSALFAYELLRRGKAANLDIVVRNMNDYFGILPDSAALELLQKKTTGQRPRGTPLFFDGLRAYENYEEGLPLPASHLDFSSPWTAWWGAAQQ